MKPYGVLKLTTTSPVQTYAEPLTRAEVRAFLQIPDFSPADADQDAQLDLFIAGAREQAELLQSRDIVAKQWDLVVDAWPVEFQLRDNLSTVDLFTWKSDLGVVTTLVENTDYIVDTARNIVHLPVAGSWPAGSLWPSSAIVLRYTVTPAPVSQTLKVGMLHLIRHWYDNRISFELGASAIQSYPFTVIDLLSDGKERWV